MIEIFENIPQSVKNKAEFVFNMASYRKSAPSIVKILNDYTNSCTNEEEKEFIRFYFNLRMQELLNGNDNNQW